MWYMTSRKRQSGQLLPIAAAAFLVMCALSGLAIDASRDYLDKRNPQNAADFAVLAAAKQMSFGASLTTPITSGSGAAQAAHDYAANNGFSTIYNNNCAVATGGGFTTSWFDVVGPPCNATAGFNNKVSVNQAAIGLPGSPVAAACSGAAKFTCVQVVITSRIAELFTSVLGISYAYVTVGSAAQTALPSSSFDAPPPNALTIYQPQSGCTPATQQCFDETKPVGRTQLS